MERSQESKILQVKHVNLVGEETPVRQALAG